MTAGLPGAKAVHLMRCLHRLPESWGGTHGHGHESSTVTKYSRRKVLASKYKFLGRHIQNIQFPLAIEAKGIILISVNEHGVMSRDSH